jgi:hypothetical protein
LIDLLAHQVAVLQDQVALLKERDRLDSGNSSGLPSSDGPGRGGNRAQRQASARQRDARKSHTGSCRALLGPEQVDAVHNVAPSGVCECGSAFAARGKPLLHHVCDLPPVVQPDIQEYRSYRGMCTGCGRVRRLAVPAGVPSGQISPRALAHIGVLGAQYHPTPFKIPDLLASLVGASTTPAGVIVSDRYSACAHLVPESRQVCWAHLLRHFKRISQRRGVAFPKPSAVAPPTRARMC